MSNGESSHLKHETPRQTEATNLYQISNGATNIIQLENEDASNFQMNADVDSALSPSQNHLNPLVLSVS